MLLCYFGTSRLNRILKEDAFEVGLKEGRASAMSGVFPGMF